MKLDLKKETFVNYHLFISKNEFLRQKSLGKLNAYLNDINHDCAQTSFELNAFAVLLNRVGGSWGWNRRPE